MTLCDTGALIAILDPRQGEIHARCTACMRELRAPLIITWPVLTETMYFAGKLGGWPLQNLLWTQIENGEAFRIHVPDELEVRRMRELMDQYHDTPMDIADAAIVAAAETLNLRTVFTLDSHFRIYRTREGGVFQISPE